MQEQAKDVLSGESVTPILLPRILEKIVDIMIESLEADQDDDWKIIAHVNSIYLSAGSSQNFSVGAFL